MIEHNTFGHRRSVYKSIGESLSSLNLKQYPLLFCLVLSMGNHLFVQFHKYKFLQSRNRQSHANRNVDSVDYGTQHGHITNQR